MKQNIEEDVKILEELMRKVNKHLYPFTEEEDLAFFQKKDLRDRLYGKFPKCFLKIKGMGQEIPFLPICNRMGIHDPKMIQFSTKLANRMKENPNFDQDQIITVLARLKSLTNIYSKDIPKPPLEAAKKAMTTRMFSKIKRYLDQTRGN